MAYTNIMKIIKKTYTINAPIEKVWDALVNPSTINKWGGGPSKMSSAKSFEFELWGGDIYGTNTKVVKKQSSGAGMVWREMG